jgi:hypothetical protein
MPYIRQEDRKQFEDLENEIIKNAPSTAGELQYLIAVLIREMFEGSDKRYQDCNNILGALNGANLEFYRRTVAPYEDICIDLHGDV